jgi:hypothetical protein
MRYLLLYVLLSCGQFVYSQSRVDSSQNSLGGLDSLRIKSLSSLSDTLSMAELDRIDRNVNDINRKIDSLNTLNLSTDHYQKKLDSISSHLQSRLNVRQKLDSMQRAISNKLTGRLQRSDSLQLRLLEEANRLKQKVDSRKTSIDPALLQLKDPLTGEPVGDPTKALLAIDKNLLGNLKMPNTNGQSVPSVSLQNTGSLPKDVNSGIPKLNVPGQNELHSKGLDSGLKPNVGGIGGNEMKELQNETQKLKSGVREVQELGKDVAEIRKGNLDSVKSVETQAGKQLARVSELDELKSGESQVKTAKNMLQQYTDMVETLKKENINSKAKEVAQTEVRDQFAGQEQNLKSGIEQLDKLKKKYHTVPDSRYLPKHVPNIFRGRPFRERVVPGIGYQVFMGADAAIDLQPYVAYKLSGRFRPGFGGSYRVLVGNGAIQYGKVYALRAFNDLRLLGQMYFHLEGEWTHTDPSVMPQYTFPADPKLTEWKTRMNAGILKVYQISKRFNGQAQVLYNVADMTRFPSTANTSLRFGFEYKFKVRN